MTLAGRPIQKSGDAPVAPGRPVKVELGRPLEGMYVQALGAGIDVSWDGSSWLSISPGPPQHFWVSAPFVLVRASGGPARYSILGVLV